MIKYNPDRPLLFLDIDGVLNGHETLPLQVEVFTCTINAEAVRLLNLVLKHTDSQFVLSSAWRYFCYRDEMTLTGLSWLLRTHGIDNRFVGITNRDTMLAPQQPKPNERGEQISQWLTSHQHRSLYAVVDDLDLGITAAGHPFVQTDGRKGMSPKNCVELIRLLSTPGRLPG